MGIPTQLPGVLTRLTAVGDQLAFFRSTVAAGAELWFSDGSPGGTRQVVDLIPGPSSGGVTFADAAPVSDGERLWFVGSSPGGAQQVFVSDGTAAGTLSAGPGPSGAAVLQPRDLTLVGDSLLFRRGGVGGSEVFAVDRLSLTVAVLDVLPPVRFLESRGSFGLPDVVFLAPQVGFEFGQPLLWATDGTMAGTRSLVPFVPALPEFNGFGGVATQLGSDGTFLIDSDEGPYLSDGTQAGTRPVSPGLGLAEADSRDALVLGNEVLLQLPGGLFSVPLAELGVTSLTPLGVSCPLAPELGGSGLPRIGQAVTLELGEGRPGQFGLLLLSQDLAAAPSVGVCSLGLLLPRQLAVVTLDGAGAASLPVTVPANPALVGEAFELQYAGLQFGGPILSLIETSNVLEAVIGG